MRIRAGTRVQAFTGEKEVSSHKLITAGEPKTIVANADKSQFHQGNKELTHIEVMLHDQQGNPVVDAVNEVTVTIDGPARLLAMESGDLTSHEDYLSNTRKMYNGQLLVYVQSNGKVGRVKVTLASPGLPSKEIIVDR